MPTIEELTADLMGFQTAHGSVIRALIKTHPDPSGFLAACYHEHQESLALLTSLQIPDRVLTAFHTAWELVGPANLDG